MSKNNFFEKKNDWSKIKDQLLGCYLKLYFSKILTNGSPVTYIDAFAGKGMFEDGEKGSPFIALDLSKEAISSSRNSNAKIDCFFIKCKYATELTADVRDSNVTIINGNFEDEIEKLLQQCVNRNVFLYVDPFGIKSLHFDKFYLLKKSNFKSVELLLNLNSFGFLREGCRLLQYKEFENFSEGLEERETTEGSKQVNDIANMNRVANGDYWQAIIKVYNNGIINAFDAEERFVAEYCEQLNKVFDYAIHIPIKAKKLKNMPKYRMVFCTNHKHGLIEMANNMLNRWKKMQENEQNGQIMLFEINVDFKGMCLQRDYIKTATDMLSTDYIKFDDYICLLILKYGILCEISKIKSSIKELEKNGSVDIIRNPQFTPTGQQPKWIDWKFNNKDKKDLKVRLKK